MGSRHRSPSQRLSFDSGQIVTGWLLKIVVSLVIAATVLTESAGVLLAKGSASDAAANAASDAAFAIKANQASAADAESVARETATAKGTEFVSMSIDTSAKTATVTVRKKAKTFLVQHIGPLKKYAESVATETRPYG